MPEYSRVPFTIGHMKLLENTQHLFRFGAHTTVETTEISQTENPLCDVILSRLFALEASGLRRRPAQRFVWY
jgi:hypothetical protein